jgi:hypothetical protein
MSDQECHEGVTRREEFQPCEKTAVAMRLDPEEGHPYPVCARHARADMVSLSSVERNAIHEALHQWRVHGSGDMYGWMTQYAHIPGGDE